MAAKNDVRILSEEVKQRRVCHLVFPLTFTTVTLSHSTSAGVCVCSFHSNLNFLYLSCSSFHV